MESIKQKKYDRQRISAADRLIDLVEFVNKFSEAGTKINITVASDIMEAINKEVIYVDPDRVDIVEDPELRPTTIHVEVLKD